MTKVMINKEMIEVAPKYLLSRTGTLYWKDIIEVKTYYPFFPEVGNVDLISQPSCSKKSIKIPLAGMPINLLIDILSHVSPETKITLYPYLEKRIAAHKKGKLDIGIRS